jgi:hypothetical protein
MSAILIYFYVSIEKDISEKHGVAHHEQPPLLIRLLYTGYERGEPAGKTDSRAGRGYEKTEKIPQN